MFDQPLASKVDVRYALQGKALAREHRTALAATLEAMLPWLSDPEQAGTHRINTVTGAGQVALLSQRASLRLRVRRERLAELTPLSGATIDVGGFVLHLSDAPAVRELLPYGTLYSHLVTSQDDDELAFLQTVGRELDALGVTCRPICGRRQLIEGDGEPLLGYSLMLDGLTTVGSLRVLETGLGRHRRLGCGIFVPHKSAAPLHTQ